MLFVRTALPEDLHRIQVFDEWKEATAERIDAGECAVSCEGDEILGFVVYDRSFFKEHFVAFLMVEETHRRKGIGSTLLAHVESVVGQDVLYISTGLKNVAMHGLLGRRGYRVAGMVDLEGYTEMIYAKKMNPDSSES